MNGTASAHKLSRPPRDVITVLLDEAEPEYPAEDGELTVLYEDEGILVVDKPAGMLIHPPGRRNQGTLANLVAGYYRRSGQKSPRSIP